MRKKSLIMFAALVIFSFILVGCDQAYTVKNNLQQEADRFDIYRKMTFVNLYANELLYEVEGYFSLQTTYANDYQGQQEIAIIVKTGTNQFKMHYFSIANNVTYVIEQLENTTTNPYHWNIVWYVPLPNIVGG